MGPVYPSSARVVRVPSRLSTVICAVWLHSCSLWLRSSILLVVSTPYVFSVLSPCWVRTTLTTASPIAFCAANKVKEGGGQKLFKALGKVEAEHASVWKKILKLDSLPKGDDSCSGDYKADLEDSHARETRAIEFYKKAAAESENERVKQIFEAFVEVEVDHLQLSEERLK